MKKFKAAVIGCGWIGAQTPRYHKDIQPATHAEAYYKNPKIELVALVDQDRHKLKKAGAKYSNVRLYQKTEAMLAQEKPDIVSIATPNQTHYLLAKLAAKNNCRAILLEKPIAQSLKEAKELIRICKKQGVKLFVNHFRRFDPILNKWSVKVKKGIIGDILQGHLTYYNGLHNNGSHWIDLMRMFLGEVDYVMGKYNPLIAKLDKELKRKDNIDSVIVFKNQTTVTLQSLTGNYGHSEFLIYGTKGTLELKNLAYQIVYRKKIANEHFSGVFQLSPRVKREGNHRSFMAPAIENVVEVLERRAKSLSTGEEAFKTLQVLTKIEESARKNGAKVFVK